MPVEAPMVMTFPQQDLQRLRSELVDCRTALYLGAIVFWHAVSSEDSGLCAGVWAGNLIAVNTKEEELIDEVGIVKRQGGIPVKNERVEAQVVA